jgi:hypothetical protein
MRDVHAVPFWNVEITLLSVAPGSSVQRLEKRRMYSRRLSPRLLLAVAQLPLLVGAHVGALKVTDKDLMWVGPVIDLVPRQVHKPCRRRVTEVERQVLYDKEVSVAPPAWQASQ